MNADVYCVGPAHPVSVKKHLYNMFTSLYRSVLDKTNEPHKKLRTYNLVKCNYKKELYLDHINSADLRRSVSKT